MTSLKIGDLVLFESILPSTSDYPVSSSLLSTPKAVPVEVRQRSQPPHQPAKLSSDAAGLSSSSEDEEQRRARASLLLALHKSSSAEGVSIGSTTALHYANSSSYQQNNDRSNNVSCVTNESTIARDVW